MELEGSEYEKRVSLPVSEIHWGLTLFYFT